MSDEFKEAISIGWHVFSAVCGAVLTLVVHAFKFGGRMEKFVTRDQLEHTLEDYARKDQMDAIERRLDRLAAEQRKDFRTVISLLQGDKE